MVGKKRRTKEYDAKYYYFLIKLWAFIVLRVRARTKKNPSKKPAFSTFRRSDFPTTFQKRRPFDDQRQKNASKMTTFCRKASLSLPFFSLGRGGRQGAKIKKKQNFFSSSIIFKIAKSVSSFHSKSSLLLYRFSFNS